MPENLYRPVRNITSLIHTSRPLVYMRILKLLQI